MLYNSIDRKNVLNCCSLFLNVRKLYKSEKKVSLKLVTELQFQEVVNKLMVNNSIFKNNDCLLLDIIFTIVSVSVH